MPLSALRVVAAPSVEPVSLAEAKSALRVDHGLDDDLITGLIVAARERLEGYTGRSLAEQTLEAVWSGPLADGELDGGLLELPRPPFGNLVEAVYRVDAGESEQAITPTVLASVEPARLDASGVPALGADGYLRVRYVAGYTALPSPLRQAIIATVISLYDDPLADLPQRARDLAAPYRVYYG